jgi:hypothetical protein
MVPDVLDPTQCLIYHFHKDKKIIEVFLDPINLGCFLHFSLLLMATNLSNYWAHRFQSCWFSNYDKNWGQIRSKRRKWGERGVVPIGRRGPGEKEAEEERLAVILEREEEKGRKRSEGWKVSSERKKRWIKRFLQSGNRKNPRLEWLAQ